MYNRYKLYVIGYGDVTITAQEMTINDRVYAFYTDKLETCYYPICATIILKIERDISK